MEKGRATPGISYWLPKKLLMLKQNPFVHGTYLMRKDRLQALGGYDEYFRFAQDYELMTRWFRAGYSVKFPKQSLYQTRQVAESISQSKREQQSDYGKKYSEKMAPTILKYANLISNQLFKLNFN